MATIEIDDETFMTLSTQAAAHGLSVAEWLKNTTANVSTGVSHTIEQPIQERLERFDQLTRRLARRNIGSCGMLDDSRETIYADRGR